MATYDLTSTIPSKIKTGDILNCPYGGSALNITLPKGTYKLECWGAQGGCNSTTTTNKGGYATGLLNLNNKTNIYIYAGGQGSSTLAGFNGGGAVSVTYTSATGYGGGGGSDIRIGTDSLYARVIVAGGGGGNGVIYNTIKDGSSVQVAGGACESNGALYQESTSVTPTDVKGYAGGQTAGGTASTNSNAGSFGTGGDNNGSYYSTSIYAVSGGGGGGWYGGSSGGYYIKMQMGASTVGGGGGGSSYVYTSSTATNYPSDCLLNSSYYLTDASTTTGTSSFTDYDGSTVTGHSGNGACRITAIDVGGFDVIKFKNSNELVENDLGVIELPYLLSTGVEYIETGITPNSNTSIEIEFKPTDITNVSAGNTKGCNPFGVGISYNSSAFELYTYDSCFHHNWGNTNNIMSSLPASLNKFVLKNNYSTKTFSLTNEDTGVIYEGSVSSLSFTAPGTLRLFGMQRIYSGTTSTYYSGPMYLYYCKIWDEDTLIKDYIPALNGSIACLYDKVNGEYVYNSSSSGNTFKSVEPNWIETENMMVKVDSSTWKNVAGIWTKTDNDTWTSILGGGNIYAFDKLYTQLEYIESSGTQYIDTGFIPNQDTRVVCNVIYETPSESSSHYLFGAREGNGVKTYGINAYGGVYQSMYGSETADGQSGISTKFVIDKNKNVVIINATTYTQTYTEFTCPVNMYLFAMNNNGSAYGYSSAKLYSCQIYDNGTLIRDFIPVKRKADSEIGLYDEVTKTFFGNMGTGSFI